MNHKYFFRIVIIVSIVFLYLIINYHNCILLKLKPVPDTIISENYGSPSMHVVFLYGNNICPTCAVGQYLYEISKQIESIYIVPNNYSDIDIDNLRTAYSLKGKIYRENNDTSKYLLKISRCVRNQQIKNIFIEIRKGRKIKKVFAL